MSLKAQSKLEELSAAVRIVAELRENGNLEKVLGMLAAANGISVQGSRANGV